MSEETPLRVGEFDRAMKSLERSINTRFDSLDEQVGTVRGTIQKNSERIAVLEDADKTQRTKQLTWASVISVIGVGIIEAGKRFLGM